MITEAEAVVERFAYVYAAAMLVALCASLALGSPLPAVAAGAVGLFVLVRAHRGRFTPNGAFGAANGVTLLRLALIAGLPFLEPAPGPRSALCVGLVFGLDGLDGLVARRTGQVSEFGARFDMECDALLVLLGSLVLYLRQRSPGFILVPGALRYAYALSLAFAPKPPREAPRSRFGRYVFSVFVLALCASLWPIPIVHVPFAIVASALIVWSFARSFYYSFAR